MDSKMEELLRKKIGLLEEQCEAYQDLVNIQKTDIDNLTKQVELSEIIIKKQSEMIEIINTIDVLEEKKRNAISTLINQIEELRKN